MNRFGDRDYDYIDLDLDDDSDQERAESSDDEIDIILQGTPEQKKKFSKKKVKESSSEDDFEKEMNRELNETMKKMRRKKKQNKAGADTENSTTQCGESSGNTEKSDAKQFYDEIYFDSDEEEMVSEGDERQKNHPVISNDDLLYDPDLDDDDQQWIDRKRQQYQPNLASKNNKCPKLPNSDAVLNCPACMTTLCLDCQRHDVYQHQYRAMFVMNCSVDRSEKLKYPIEKPKQVKNKKFKKQKTSEISQAGTEDMGKSDDSESYNPVKCTECDTVVAVYDKDEVYHFFNILAGYG